MGRILFLSYSGSVHLDMNPRILLFEQRPPVQMCFISIYNDLGFIDQVPPLEPELWLSAVERRCGVVRLSQPDARNRDRSMKPTIFEWSRRAAGRGSSARRDGE